MAEHIVHIDGGHRFESCCDHQNPRSKGLGYFLFSLVFDYPITKGAIISHPLFISKLPLLFSTAANPTIR